MSARKPYPSDLAALPSDNIEHLFPKPTGPTGRKRVYDRKDLVDAVLYLTRTGCPWRDSGLWERLQDSLRRDGRRVGRDAECRGD